MARTKRTNVVTKAAVEQETAMTLSKEAQELLEQLEEQRITLEFRLRTGEELIAAARSRGEEVSRWEAHWIGLLGDYEQVSLQMEQVVTGEVSPAGAAIHSSAA